MVFWPGLPRRSDRAKSKKINELPIRRRAFALLLAVVFFGVGHPRRSDLVKIEKYRNFKHENEKSS